MKSVLLTLDRTIKNVYQYAKEGNDLECLLTGKSSMEYISTIKKMQNLGLAIPSKYITDSYTSNDNYNKNLDFMLKSLK